MTGVDAKKKIPYWHRELVQAVRQALRKVAPCQSFKHDGVHSDMACWSCGGSLISPKASDAAQVELDRLVAVIVSQQQETGDG